MDEFICLLTQHRNVLERFVRFRISNSFDADDIIQETCISAYRSFSSLKDTALFKSWIISIARNKCNDYFRQLAKNMELPIDEITGGHPPYGRMGVTAASPVKETLQKLGDKDKQVLYQYYFREFPQNEIARRLGIPIGTVKSRLHTAKSNFKKLYPHHPKVRGGNIMKIFPEYLPEYRIEKSDKEPFAVRFEELLGWFIIPKLYEKCSWAQYDMPGRNITDIYSSTVEKRVVLHGIEGVEIKNTHRRIGTGTDKETDFYFIAQLTEEYCRWLGNRYCENGVEHIITFLDGDEFLSAWGAGENNVGEPVNIKPRGIITRNGDDVIAGTGSVTDCVGRYTVHFADKVYDTNLLISIFNDGPLTEQYIDKNGRTVLWRRFNRDDWAIERYGQKWSERFPKNDRINVNGINYVHWYDCISDYIG
mgnify:CR=1 FL=1